MKREEEKTRKKKEYKRPSLSIYGDFKRITKVTTKGGNKQDGGGKPRTRATGIPT
jgi:hypothetical protein